MHSIELVRVIEVCEALRALMVEMESGLVPPVALAALPVKVMAVPVVDRV